MSSAFRQILTQVNQRSVKGFLCAEEAQCLYQYCLQVAGLGPCLELGSYCGKSTVFLASACKAAGSAVFAVDHHRGSEEQQPGQAYHDETLVDEAGTGLNTLPEFQRTINRFQLEPYVIPVLASSELTVSVWRTPLSFVFIDGGHSLDSAMHDFLNWSEHVIPGGVLALHDIYLHPEDGGQAPFVAFQALLQKGEFFMERKAGSLVILRRFKSASAVKVVHD